MHNLLMYLMSGAPSMVFYAVLPNLYLLCLDQTIDTGFIESASDFIRLLVFHYLGEAIGYSLAFIALKKLYHNENLFK